MTQPSVRLSAVLALLVLVICSVTVNAGQEVAALRGKIRQSLESLLASQAKGIENCENKCDKAFNRFAYAISTAGDQATFEFRACVQGCEQCQVDRDNGADVANCFHHCKNFDWRGQGILKGVIEPDKACIGGCIINTCQVMCSGGTTDDNITPANRQFFYPNGGCSIKTEPYSQNLEYVPWDSPNTGQGGSQSVAECCSNALSLCEYVGNRDSTNYRKLLDITQKFCREFVPSGSEEAICEFQSRPQNCGST
jgi:hypothetical protein